MNQLGDDDKELPTSVTMLILPIQAKKLAEFEANGNIHLSLVYRGNAENTKKFIEKQDLLLHLGK